MIPLNRLALSHTWSSTVEDAFTNRKRLSHVAESEVRKAPWLYLQVSWQAPGRTYHLTLLMVQRLLIILGECYFPGRRGGGGGLAMDLFRFYFLTHGHTQLDTDNCVGSFWKPLMNGCLSRGSTVKGKWCGESICSSAPDDSITPFLFHTSCL